jgi:CHC2 zinc finger
MSLQLENLAAKLDGVKRSNDGGIMGRCPCHADSTASFHASDGQRGVIGHCFGCGASAEQVCAKVGIEVAALFFTPRNGSTSSSSHTNGRNGHTGRAPDVSYQIRNAENILIATHHRFEAREGEKKKLFWQAAGNAKWTLDGMPLPSLPLYGTEHAATWPEDAGVVVT